MISLPNHLETALVTQYFESATFVDFFFLRWLTTSFDGLCVSDLCMRMYLYTARITQSGDGLQFFSFLGEIGRQLVKAPLAATISPYLVSTIHQYKHEMLDETRDRDTPPHWELRAL